MDLLADSAATVVPEACDAITALLSKDAPYGFLAILSSCPDKTTSLIKDILPVQHPLFRSPLSIKSWLHPALKAAGASTVTSAVATAGNTSCALKTSLTEVLPSVRGQLVQQLVLLQASSLDPVDRSATNLANLDTAVALALAVAPVIIFHLPFRLVSPSSVDAITNTFPIGMDHIKNAIVRIHTSGLRLGDDIQGGYSPTIYVVVDDFDQDVMNKNDVEKWIKQQWKELCKKSYNMSSFSTQSGKALRKELEDISLRVYTLSSPYLQPQDYAKDAALLREHFVNPANKTYVFNPESKANVPPPHIHQHLETYLKQLRLYCDQELLQPSPSSAADDSPLTLTNPMQLAQKSRAADASAPVAQQRDPATLVSNKSHHQEMVQRATKITESNRVFDAVGAANSLGALPSEDQLEAAFACAAIQEQIYDQFSNAIGPWIQSAQSRRLIRNFGTDASKLLEQTIHTFQQEAEQYKDSPAFNQQQEFLKNTITMELKEIFASQIERLNGLGFDVFRQKLSRLSTTSNLEVELDKAVNDADKFFREKAQACKMQDAPWKFDHERRLLLTLLRESAAETLQKAKIQGSYVPNARVPLALSFHYLNPDPVASFQNLWTNKISPTGDSTTETPVIPKNPDELIRSDPNKAKQAGIMRFRPFATKGYKYSIRGKDIFRGFNSESDEIYKKIMK